MKTNKELIWIRAQKNSPSDETLLVSRVLARSGEVIREGDVLAEVEGAKSVFEIESPARGFVYFYVKEGDVLRINEVLAVVSSEPLFEQPKKPKTEDLSAIKSTGVGVFGDLRLTDRAREFAIRVSLDKEELHKAFENKRITDKEVKRFFTSNFEAREFKHQEPARILFLGGGRGARIAYHNLDQSLKAKVVGLLDDQRNSIEEEGVPLLGGLSRESLRRTIEDYRVDGILISISKSMDLRRVFLNTAREFDLKLVSVVSKQAFVSDDSILGEGLIAPESSRIGSRATVGDNVFLSAFVNIEHDCVVGDNTTFGPGVFLSGGVIIGKNCVLGSNIAIEPNLLIGEGSVIASGVTVTQDVDRTTIVKTESVNKQRPISSY